MSDTEADVQAIVGLLSGYEAVVEIGTNLDDEVEVRIRGTNDKTAGLLAELLSNGWVIASLSTELDHAEGVSIWIEPLSRKQNERCKSNP